MTREEIKSTAISIAERLGVPCAILAVFIWMTREAAVTMHKTVVMPIVESHTEFLDSTRENLNKMCETQEKQAETLEELAVGQREIKSVLVTSGSKNFQDKPKEK